ncbi:CPBP family intramembrane glutamic endopeptidase [Terricaulis sp.]|uniref:CPBP family intramembrane glutamic endopeptidase n=1 Tax=Terricaulis sp. TaxID=2768686 RepID=UPI003784F167
MHDEPGPVTAFIRSLPPWAEMVFVISVAFSLFISSNIDAVVTPAAEAEETSADAFLVVMAIELMLAGLLILFLRARGWTPPQLGVAPLGFKDAWHPIALTAVAILGSLAAYQIAIRIRPDLAAASPEIDADIPLYTWVMFSLVNAAYEEVFVCAYIVAAWRGGDIWTAIGISSVIRLSYHLYQGPMAIAVIFPLGVLFAWYFASQRRLLPLIVTHVAIDMIALWDAARS